MASDVVVVTGSSGYIGAALIPRLAEQYRVVGFDRFTPPHPPTDAECVCVDLSDRKDMEAAFERVRKAYGDKLASVVHLAAYYDFSGKPSAKYQTVTVDGTRRLLEGLQSFDVGQFVFSSTMLVHAPGRPGQQIREDSPLRATWQYPESKLHTEKLLHEKRGRMPTAVLRLAGVYDEMCRSPPIANQLRRIYEARVSSGFYPGDARTGQSFLHLDDAVEALLCTVDRRSRLAKESVYLIGEPDVVSYGEIHRLATRQLRGREMPLRRIPTWAAKAGARMGAWTRREPFLRPWMVDRSDDHYDVDIGKAERELGWKPERSLRKTLPKMVSNLKRDPLKWYQENDLPAPPSLRRSAPKAAAGGAAHGG